MLILITRNIHTIVKIAMIIKTKLLTKYYKLGIMHDKKMKIINNILYIYIIYVYYIIYTYNLYPVLTKFE